MTTIYWTITYEWFGFLKPVYTLFSNNELNQLIGIIPDISFRKPAEIHGKMFVILDRKNFSIPKEYDLLDAVTKSVVCEIKEYSNGDIHAIISKGKVYNIGIGYDDNPSQINNLIIQKYNDKLFNAKSGRLEIRSTEHQDILIACAFFVLHLRISSMN